MISRDGWYRSLFMLPLLLAICQAGCAGGPTAATTTPGGTCPAPGPGVSRADLDSAMEEAGSIGGDPRRIEVLHVALKELGKRGVLGGEGPDVWDCSGLVKHSFEEVGVELPRVTFDQVDKGTEVPRGQYEPADLIFFNRNGHVGIYIGGGLMIHAKCLVRVEKVSRYRSLISAVRRVLP